MDFSLQVYTIEPEPMYRNMIEKFIETNGLHGKITVLHKYADQVTEDDLDGRKVSWNIRNNDTGMRIFQNFPDLRGHSRGNPRSGLLFIGGGGGGGVISSLSTYFKY